MKDTVPLIDHLARIVSLICVFIIPGFFVWRAARRSYKRVQDAHPPMVAGAKGFIVAYAGAAHFQNPGKNLVYEAVGRLQLEPGSVLFRGEWFDGEVIELKFLPRAARVAWIGRRWRNGIAAWFVLEQAGQKYYFTSDAILRGPLALGFFKRSAQALYREVGQILPSSSFEAAP